MKLKKINEKLREGLKTDNRGQYYRKKLFCFKSGGLCDYLAKRKEIHNYCYQCDPALVCEGEQSPRALIIVEDKAKVLEMEAIFEKFERHTDLVVYGVHDSDMEYDKNYMVESMC
jgi:hypothetical protein